MFARLATRRTVLLTVAVVLGVVLMLNLAAWQWDRHVARREFNAALAARLGDPAVPLADLLVLDPADAEWRTANAVGEYVDGADLRVVNRSQDGRAGTNAVSLLRLEDGSFVYVVRGFLPLDLEPSAPPSGRVEVTGRVRISDERRTGEVSDPASGVLTEVQRLDLGRLASQVPGTLAAVSLDLVASSPADDPRLATVALPGSDLGPHLSYMVQWILFSTAAVAGWVLVLRRELRRTPRRDG
jgi:cytochrome oxidase assembly protein ShyY1